MNQRGTEEGLVAGPNEVQGQQGSHGGWCGDGVAKRWSAAGVGMMKELMARRTGPS